MIRFSWRHIFVFAIMLGCLSRPVLADKISEGLQQVVLDYAVTTGNDISETKRNTEKILERLTELMVSPCELSSEFRGKLPRTVSETRYVLNDLVEKKLQAVRLAEEMILKQLDVQRAINDKDRESVRDLAIKVAANSMTLSELRESIIPKLFKAAGENLDRVNAIDIKLDLLELELRRLDSVCDKVEILWRERQERVAGKPQLPEPGAPEPKGETVWRTVNGTKWEPQAYATMKELCRNPRPGPSDVVFDTIRRTNHGWMSHRYYGDIWVDCSGRVVMVLKPGTN